MTDLIYYDPKQEPGSTLKLPDGRTAKIVSAEEYYSRQVAYVTNIAITFLNIGPAGAVPEEERNKVDDAVADAYWNQYQGCILPPRVMRAIARAGAEGKGRMFLEFIDASRQAILTPDTTLSQAEEARASMRIDALRLGAAGRFTPYQTSVSEFLCDIFLLERASMEDVLRAENEREEGQTRAELFKKFDEDLSLSFEKMLPKLLKSSTLVDKIRTDPMLYREIEDFANRRPPHYKTGVLPKGSLE